MTYNTTYNDDVLAGEFVNEPESDKISSFRQRWGFRSLYNSIVHNNSLSKQEQTQVIRPKIPFDNYSLPSLGGYSASVSSAVNAALLQPQNQNMKTVLDRKQLEMCANVWANDGIVRRSINELVWNINGSRSKFAVGLNDELTEFLGAEKIAVKQREVFGDDDENVLKLRQKMFRANKRVKFHPKTMLGIKKGFVFGRSGLEILRFGDKSAVSNDDTRNQPEALVPLYSTRIVQSLKKKRTKEFDGFIYDDPDTPNQEPRIIKATDMIPFFNDDDTIFENTEFSGLSMIWSLLSVSQSNEVINDEDLPASVRQLWAKFGHLYTGDSKDSTTEEIMKKWLAGSILIHHKKEMKMQIEDLAHDLMEIINVRKGNVEFILWCIGLPAFLLLSNVANFATADKEAQIFKAGTLTYYRNWLRGVYEDYWYDPMLAEHLKIPIEKVIAADLKVKAVFEDLIYETRKETIEGEQILVNIGVHDEEDVLEKLGEDQLLEKVRTLKRMQVKFKEDSIKAELERRRQMGLPDQEEDQDQTDQEKRQQAEDEGQDNNKPEE